MINVSPKFSKSFTSLHLHICVQYAACRSYTFAFVNSVTTASTKFVLFPSKTMCSFQLHTPHAVKYKCSYRVLNTQLSYLACNRLIKILYICSQPCNVATGTNLLVTITF